MSEIKPLKTRGVQGSAQFITQKKKMLAAFDSAREEAGAHEVGTYHGRVAEAEFRKWLTDFLPKKFGVTSGYIVSQGHYEETKLPEFDVIIYDALEAPVLWIEENRDASTAGWKRAIPAEHVRAVIEVKASFTPRHAKEAIEHLNDLKPLLTGQFHMLSTDVRVIHPIVSFAVFFELTKKYERSKTVLNNLVQGHLLPGFMGALILRGEGRPSDEAAMVELWPLVDQQGNPVSMKSTLNHAGWSMLNKQTTMSDSLQIDKDLVHAMMIWKPSKFAIFAFDLIAMLNGTYKRHVMSSGHGLRFIVE